MTRAGSAVSFNQDPVTIQRTRLQKRGNGNTYTYVYVYDQNKRRSYWIDKRAVTPYASISPVTVFNNVTAYINQSERNDGIYSSGPALTSTSTMSADGKASSYDGDLVQVQKIVTTQRGSSQTPYQYAQVKDGTKTFWIDVRALFDTVTLRPAIRSQMVTSINMAEAMVYTTMAHLSQMCRVLYLILTLQHTIMIQ